LEGGGLGAGVTWESYLLGEEKKVCGLVVEARKERVREGATRLQEGGAEPRRIVLHGGETDVRRRAGRGGEKKR